MRGSNFGLRLRPLEPTHLRSMSLDHNQETLNRLYKPKLVDTSVTDERSSDNRSFEKETTAVCTHMAVCVQMRESINIGDGILVHVAR